MAIADNSGNNSFNTRFVYGGTGLGKTHLIQSIGNRVKQQFEDELAVLYVSSESFTNEFVQAIRNNRASEFSVFYKKSILPMGVAFNFLAGKRKTKKRSFTFSMPFLRMASRTYLAVNVRR